MNYGLQQRLLEGSIPVPEAGCWLWLGLTDMDGYGRLTYQYADLRAHRAAHDAFVGPIPEGMFVCHKCDTPACINPQHLFLGTARDNTADMIAKGRFVPTPRRTHCINGHAYTPSNTYWCRVPTGLKQQCRECNRAAQQRYQQRRRAA